MGRTDHNGSMICLLPCIKEQHNISKVCVSGSNLIEVVPVRHKRAVENFPRTFLVLDWLDEVRQIPTKKAIGKQNKTPTTQAIQTATLMLVSNAEESTRVIIDVFQFWGNGMLLKLPFMPGRVTLTFDASCSAPRLTHSAHVRSQGCCSAPGRARS